jgi:hypothetical protein
LQHAQQQPSLHRQRVKPLMGVSWAQLGAAQQKLGWVMPLEHLRSLTDEPPATSPQQQHLHAHAWQDMRHSTPAQWQAQHARLRASAAANGVVGGVGGAGGVGSSRRLPLFG